MLQINEQAKAILLDALNNKNDKVIMKMANLLLVQEGFPIIDEYRRELEEMFNSGVEVVDFHNNSKQITKDVNQWVNNQTNGKINSLFEDDLPTDTPMVLLNAIYFKGFWQYLFDRKSTRKDLFFNFGKEGSNVDMMVMKRDMLVKWIRPLKASIFEMPFAEGSDMTMMVVSIDWHSIPIRV